MRWIYILDFSLKLLVVVSEGWVFLVQTKVGQMSVDVAHSLSVEFVGHRAKPHQPVPVYVDTKRVKARDQNVHSEVIFVSLDEMGTCYILAGKPVCIRPCYYLCSA